MTNDDSTGFLGLASASIAGSFTTAQSALSLIYDSMTVQWNNGGAAPKRMPSTSFAILATPATRGRSVQFELSGFSQPPGAGSIELDVGGTRSSVQLTEESFRAEVTVTLSADADTTPVIVTLNLPEPDDGSATMLGLDTIDISLPAGEERC